MTSVGTTGTKIDPDGWYDDTSIYTALEVSSQTLARARREGRLRHSKKGNRILYLGRWLIDWLTTDSAPEMEEASHV